MKKLSFLLILSLILITTSCAVKVPLKPEVFKSSKRVGLILVNNSINNYRAGSQGLLDVAITQGNKYQEGLEIASKAVELNKKLKELYINCYKYHGKDITIINESIQLTSLTKYNKPSGSRLKYFKYDLRSLKEKYQIDELIIADAKYGIIINYYGFIELSRFGLCDLSSSIVNLDDNSLEYSNKITSNIPITGKWKMPPNYEKLTNSITQAVVEVCNKEKVKFKF